MGDSEIRSQTAVKRQRGKSWKTTCLRESAAKKVMLTVSLVYCLMCFFHTFQQLQAVGLFCFSLFVCLVLAGCSECLFHFFLIFHLNRLKAKGKQKKTKKNMTRLFRVGGCSVRAGNSELSHFNRWRKKKLQSDETLDNFLVLPASTVWRFAFSKGPIFHSVSDVY